MLVGTGLGDLDEWAITGDATITSPSFSRRASANLPARSEFAFTVRKTGTGEEKDITFSATSAEIDALLSTLQSELDMQNGTPVGEHR